MLCLKDQQEIGFWKGTWLERSRLKCRVVVLFIYCWSKNLKTIKLCHTTAIDWKEISSWKLHLVAFTDSKNCRRLRFARQIYDTLISHRLHRASASSTVDFRGICREIKGAQTRIFSWKLLTVCPHFFLLSKTCYRDLTSSFLQSVKWQGLTFCWGLCG